MTTHSQGAAIQNVWGDIQPSFVDSMPVGDDILRKLEEGEVLAGNERADISALPIARRREARQSLFEILREKGESGYMKFVEILETERPNLDLLTKFHAYEAKHKVKRQGRYLVCIKETSDNFNVCLKQITNLKSLRSLQNL